MYNTVMKKFVILPTVLIALLLCSCETRESSQTRFLLNTVATLTADCDDQTLEGAFSLCEDYEKLLSRTVEGSEIYKLNSGETVNVSDDTLLLIERSLYYSKLTDGKFDITVCPVSELWDFENQIIPSRDEIAEALKSVDYENIETDGNTVSLNGSKIDLGGIAKGYIADKVKEYLLENGADSAIINLGGNIVTYGRDCTVGIKRPFGEDTIASITVRDKSVVTSGIYERYIEKDGRIYHHILDVETGYGIENELASVTVIGDSSLDCDALSTVCMLSGREKATEIIEGLSDYEAVFIDRDGDMTVTAGLEIKNTKIYFK